MVNQEIYECVEIEYRQAFRAILTSRLFEYLDIISNDSINKTIQKEKGDWPEVVISKKIQPKKIEKNCSLPHAPCSMLHAPLEIISTFCYNTSG